MQRSNEQLVKLIGMRQKTYQTPVELSDEDKNSLFDLIQGEPTHDD